MNDSNVIHSPNDKVLTVLNLIYSYSARDHWLLVTRDQVENSHFCGSKLFICTDWIFLWNLTLDRLLYTIHPILFCHISNYVLKLLLWLIFVLKLIYFKFCKGSKGGKHPFLHIAWSTKSFSLLVSGVKSNTPVGSLNLLL